MDPTIFTTHQFLLFILVLFRVAGVMVTAPVLSAAAWPDTMKIGLAAAIALIAFPLVPTVDVELPRELGGFLWAGGTELVMGFLLGLAAQMIFVGVQLAGLFVGQQIGLTIASVIDPVSNEQTSILSQINYILAVLVFLAMQGHLWIIDAIVGTFEVVPLGGLRNPSSVMNLVSGRMAAGALEVGMKLAIPTMMALLLVTIAMAFIARTVPEVNVFIVGFALRILTGFAFLFVTVPFVAGMTQRAFEGLHQDLEYLVTLFGSTG